MLTFQVGQPVGKEAKTGAQIRSPCTVGRFDQEKKPLQVVCDSDLCCLLALLLDTDLSSSVYALSVRVLRKLHMFKSNP